MSLQLSKGISKSLKFVIIFLLTSVLGTSFFFFYVLPLLTTQVDRIVVDPMEFRIQSFGFALDELLQEESKDFIYREIPKNPFKPLDSPQVEEDYSYYFSQKIEIPFRVTGIVGGGSDRLAIIEGDSSSFILRVGDTFRGYRVINITKNEVLVTDEMSLTYSLYLGGGYGESI